MARDANGVQKQQSNGEDLEPYYRLVEMQKQMIDLIQQNANTERTCALLREQLAQEIEAVTRPRRRLPERLRESASGLLKRFMGGAREDSETRTAQPPTQERLRSTNQAR